MNKRQFIGSCFGIGAVYGLADGAQRPLEALTNEQLIHLVYDLDFRVRYKSFAYQEYIDRGLDVYVSHDE